MWITGGFQIAWVEIPVGAHLTDDEHVPSLDDTLLHLGFQCLTNISFILITVSCVNVAKSGSDAGFDCTLDCGGEKIGGLQQLKPGCNLAAYRISLKICLINRLFSPNMFPRKGWRLVRCMEMCM